MSLVLNMVGGGGGGSLKDTDAILTVTVPTGSTVTMTKGGVTLTPTMWVKAADTSLDCAIFSIPASQFDSTTPWTVTATDGTDTASTTVLITTNREYEVELSYLFYLFREGYGLTNGYSISYSTNGGSGAGGSSDLNKISLTYTASFVIKPSVDITDYTLLCFNVISLTLDYQNRCWIALSTDGGIGNGGVNSSAANQYINNTGVISLDISTYSGSYYAAGKCTGDSRISISDIWLSR